MGRGGAPAGMIAASGELRLRPLTEGDVPRMARWRSDPRVLEFYSGRDRPLDEAGVRRHYLERRDEPTPGGVEEYQACIVEEQGRPVGFLQFYRLRPTDADAFGYPRDERSFGLDLFIGEIGRWGRGLGARVLEFARDHLVRDLAARRVVADPRADNARSVRALERAGFRKVRRLPAHEEFEGLRRDGWLMEFP